MSSFSVPSAESTTRSCITNPRTTSPSPQPTTSCTTTEECTPKNLQNGWPASLPRTSSKPQPRSTETSMYFCLNFRTCMYACGAMFQNSCLNDIVWLFIKCIARFIFITAMGGCVSEKAGNKDGIRTNSDLVEQRSGLGYELAESPEKEPQTPQKKRAMSVETGVTSSVESA